MPDITHGPTFAWLLDEAVHSLRSLGRRSILALLGIMVGSAAIIALLNIGHNAAEDVMRAFRQMGTDRLVVNFPIVQNARPLPATVDAAALRQAVPALSRVAPLSFFATAVRHGGKTAHARLIGATADLAPVINLTMATGRFLSEFDQKSTFAVVGAQLARELGEEGRPLQPGDRLQIGSYLLTSSASPAISPQFTDTDHGGPVHHGAHRWTPTPAFLAGDRQQPEPTPPRIWR